jgi:hypothetical protein
MIFAKIKEEIKNEIPDFKILIVDEQTLETAFDYVVKIIGLMANYFISFADVTGYDSFFETTDSETYNIATLRIQQCGNKVKQICGMIYEYLHKETVQYSENEMTFNPTNAPNVVNAATYIAQGAIKGYNGELSIEIPCQVYDLTIDEFNSALKSITR